MTNEEAIKQLEFDKDMILFNPSNGEVQSIEQVKIHNEDNYNTYMADCKAIEALEKQIPKKPVKSGVTDSKGIFYPINGITGVPYDLCPNCKINLCTAGMIARKKTEYCQDCGQKLDWSEIDE